MAGQLPWGGISTFTAWLGNPSLPTSLPAPTQPLSFVGGVGHKKTMSALVNTLAWDSFYLHSCFWCYIWEGFAFHSDQRDLLLFSSGRFIILALTFRSTIHLEFICMYDLRKGFWHWVSICLSTICWKRLFFPPLDGLGTFVKSQLTINVKIYFWILSSVQLIWMSMYVAHYFDYSDLVLSFKIKHVSPSVVRRGSCYHHTLSVYCFVWPLGAAGFLVHQCFQVR